MNYLAQKFTRAVDGLEQHRLLQPHLTRSQRRRSGDGVRSGRRHVLLPRDRGDGRHPPLGLQRAGDAPDLLPPPAEGRAQRRPAVRGRPAAHLARRSGPTAGSASTSAPTSRCRTRWRARSSHAGLAQPRLHRARHDRLRRVRARRVEPFTLERGRARDRRAGRGDPRARARLRPRRPRAALLDARHHRAPQRRRQRARRSSTWRCCAATSGRCGSGLNPLRGQNNVQGGGDMGAIPNKLPGFQDIERDAEARAKFERGLGRRRSAPSTAGT